MLNPDPAWRYEPCDSSEGERQPDGKPYPHAVRGVRPAKTGRAVVTGYGRTEPLAGENARERALQYDAAEVLGAPQTNALPVGAELKNTSTGMCIRWDGKKWEIV